MFQWLRSKSRIQGFGCCRLSSLGARQGLGFEPRVFGASDVFLRLRG